MMREGGASVACIIILALIFLKRRPVPNLHIAGLCAFTFYCAGVCLVTGLTPMSGGFRWPDFARDIAFVPFAGMAAIVRDAVAWGEPLFAVRNIAGNVAMFVPLGFFLPLLWPRYQKALRTLCFGALATLGIELIQLFLSRGCDIDDLILNFAGAAAGYGVYRLTARLLPRLSARFTLPQDACASPWRCMPYLCVAVPLAVTMLFGYLDRVRYMLA